MKEHFHITLRAEPGRWQAGPEQRLGRALKCLLRAFGLRAMKVEPSKEPAKNIFFPEPQEQGDSLVATKRVRT